MQMKTTNNRLHTAALAVAIITLMFAAAPRVAGADQPSVTVNLEAKKVVLSADGKEEFLPADQAAPGETLRYTAVYHNTTQKPIHGLEATLPIPAGMEYVAGSATPAGARASADGTTFQPVPLTHKVKAADGTVRDEPVPLAHYRKLRWNIGELAPDASVTVSAKATISRTQP
jgi:uncharacterized repeat protein (TIGR01451 family)